MRRGAILVWPLVVALGACSGQAVEGRAVGAVVTGARPPSSEVAQPPVTVPESPVAEAEGKCPYLDNSFVADANGQRVGKVRVAAGEPPACFFYRSDGRVQLTAWVFVGEAAQAKAIVDRAAPIATSDPASLPAGWTGGSQSTTAGAVFAVAKDGTAVVITTNQAQTIKAKRVAEKAIATLGL